MPNFIGTYGEILTRALRILTSTTPIRQQVAGSKARAMAETLSREHTNLGNLQDTNIRKPFVSTSYGKALDDIGAMVGISKYPEKSAEVTSSDRVIVFYTKYGGTFGSINNGSGFTLRAGTTITAPLTVAPELRRSYSDSDQPEGVSDRAVHYTLTSDLYCPPSGTRAFAAARALTPGTRGNIASSNLLRTHNFTDYADSNARSLLVTNLKPILNGSNSESEASFKYRISREIVRAEQANNTAVYLSALRVPGVANATIIPFMNGAGTYDLFIKSISSEVSDNIVDSVQENMNLTTATGVKGYARKPFEIGIEISSTLLLNTSVTADVRQSIIDNLELAASYYINRLAINQPLNLNALREELIGVDTRVRAVGSNSRTFFDAVFTHYPARLSVQGRRREKYLRNTISSAPNARIIVERSVDNPIRFV